MPEVQEIQNEFPRLAPPGAGIPLFERLGARYVLLPSYFRKTTWEQASETFLKESGMILERVQGLTDLQINEKRLIERMRGLEDSSRFWSISMTLEHLMIAGNHMGELIVALSKGLILPGHVSTADVKPHENRPKAEITAGFEVFVKAYEEAAMKKVSDRKSRAKYRHPWFGLLNAHQWHCMAGIHQGLHRRQVERIMKSQ